MADPSGFAVPELDGLDDSQRVSLCEVLDRLLNKGVVIVGEVSVSVAGVDLVYLGLQVVLCSMETAFGKAGGGATLSLPVAAKGSAHGRF